MIIMIVLTIVMFYNKIKNGKSQIENFQAKVTIAIPANTCGQDQSFQECHYNISAVPSSIQYIAML